MVFSLLLLHLHRRSRMSREFSSPHDTIKKNIRMGILLRKTCIKRARSFLQLLFHRKVDLRRFSG